MENLERFSREFHYFWLCWEHVLKFDTQAKFRWDACLKRIFAPGMTEHSTRIAQDALHMDKTRVHSRKKVFAKMVAPPQR